MIITLYKWFLKMTSNSWKLTPYIPDKCILGLTSRTDFIVWMLVSHSWHSIVKSVAGRLLYIQRAASYVLRVVCNTMVSLCLFYFRYTIFAFNPWFCSLLIFSWLYVVFFGHFDVTVQATVLLYTKSLKLLFYIYDTSVVLTLFMTDSLCTLL